jgi:hypothetical protein
MTFDSFNIYLFKDNLTMLSVTEIIYLQLDNDGNVKDTGWGLIQDTVPEFV